jgi:hypothetical protein
MFMVLRPLLTSWRVPYVCFAFISRLWRITLSVCTHESTCVQNSCQTFKPVKIRPLLCLEISETNYQLTLLQIPGEMVPNLHRWETSTHINIACAQTCVLHLLGGWGERRKTRFLAAVLLIERTTYCIHRHVSSLHVHQITPFITAIQMTSLPDWLWCS